MIRPQFLLLCWILAACITFAATKGKKKICAGGVSTYRINEPCPKANTNEALGHLPTEKFNLDHLPEQKHAIKPRNTNTGGTCGAFNFGEQMAFRVFGGKDAERDEFPHQIQLISYHAKTGETWVCGGVALSTRAFATCAHCVLKFVDGIPEGVRLQAYQGSSKYGEGRELTIEKIILHPDFEHLPNGDFEVDNDIAIVVVKSLPPPAVRPFRRDWRPRAPSRGPRSPTPPWRPSALG